MNFTLATPAEFLAPVVCEGINISQTQYFILVVLAALGVASIVGFIVDYFMRRRQRK